MCTESTGSTSDPLDQVAPRPGARRSARGRRRTSRSRTTLVSQSSGGSCDLEPGVGEHLRGPLGLGLGHEEVGVVVGLGRAADPGRVAAAQGEGHAGLASARRRCASGGRGSRRAREGCTAGPATRTTGSHAPGAVERPVRGTGSRVRIATFNILHGRSPGRRPGRRRPAGRRGRRRWTPTSWGCRRSTATSPGRCGADLTAVAAEAMGAVEHQFVAALSGTPGGTWMAATGEEQPGIGQLRHRAAVALPGACRGGWCGCRPLRASVPLWSPSSRRPFLARDEPRVAVAAVVDGAVRPVHGRATRTCRSSRGGTRTQLRRLVRSLTGTREPLVLMGDLNMQPAAGGAGERAAPARVRGHVPGGRARAGSSTTSSCAARCGPPGPARGGAAAAVGPPGARRPLRTGLTCLPDDSRTAATGWATCGPWPAPERPASSRSLATVVRVVCSVIAALIVSTRCSCSSRRTRPTRSSSSRRVAGHVRLVHQGPVQPVGPEDRRGDQRRRWPR